MKHTSTSSSCLLERSTRQSCRVSSLSTRGWGWLSEQSLGTPSPSPSSAMWRVLLGCNSSKGSMAFPLRGSP